MQFMLVPTLIILFFTISCTSDDEDKSEENPIYGAFGSTSPIEEEHEDLIRVTKMPSAVDEAGWRGIFRINCDFSHTSYNDPIVFFQKENGAHLHRFYGNKSIDHNSTLESVVESPESSCQGNKLNPTGYWIPAVLAPEYDQVTKERKTDSNGDPAWIVVEAVVGDDDVAHELFYYSAGIDNLDEIQTPPLGLKIVAGTASTTPEDGDQSSSIVRWHCQTWESSDGSNPQWSATIPECVYPDRVRLDIFFPNCWNGVDLDSDDHKSHMAYPINNGGPNGTVCPETHPIPIVRPSFHYAFPVLPGNSDPNDNTSKGWRLSSDNYTVSAANPGGLSIHGDWLNAWHPEIMQNILDNCIKAELDCHDGNLANGFRLSGTSEGEQNSVDIINRGLGQTHMH